MLATFDEGGWTPLDEVSEGRHIPVLKVNVLCRQKLSLNSVLVKTNLT